MLFVLIIHLDSSLRYKPVFAFTWVCVDMKKVMELVCVKKSVRLYETSTMQLDTANQKKNLIEKSLQADRLRSLTLTYTHSRVRVI